MSKRSVSNSVPNVNPSVGKKSAAQSEPPPAKPKAKRVKKPEEQDTGPLFRVGEIWKANAVFDRICKKNHEMKARLIDSGLKPWGDKGSKLILIDQLAAMILNNVELVPYSPGYKKDKDG